MMRDLSMHVLDIAQNSIKAGAKLVQITFSIDEEQWLTVTIEDDGCGMSQDFVEKVTDPFTTTRTTRKIGLGIPMFKQSAELSGGTFDIKSQVGEGTTIIAAFHLSHIDCLPMGKMCDTLFTLIYLNPDKPDFVFEATSSTQCGSFDTRIVREAMDGISLLEPEVAKWMKTSINEEFKAILEV